MMNKTTMLNTIKKRYREISYLNKTFKQLFIKIFDIPRLIAFIM